MFWKSKQYTKMLSVVVKVFKVKNMTPEQGLKGLNKGLGNNATTK